MEPMRNGRLITTLLTFVLGASAGVRAQISLATAVDLALRNSPRVKMAQADLDKAKASLSEAKDAYVPVVQTTGGYGHSTGAPLSVPVVFSISGQSLVFTYSQPDYIRSARAGIDAAEHALREAQIEVAEDATNTYVALNNALQRRAVLQQEQVFAGRLVEVTSDRVSANVDAHIELTKARRTAKQIELQLLLLDDEISGDTHHLAQLTALPPGGLTTDPASIPKFSRPLQAPGTDPQADSEGVAAAFANARAKQYVAFGDRRYLFRPQIALEANYSRVDAGLSSYAAYYPRFAGPPGGPPNSSNALGVGLQITIPLLDMAHHAKARESAADAAHALAEAHMQRDLFQEGRAKLRNAALELNARAELAQLDRDLAQDQLEALQVQLQANAADLQGPQVTPKDELNARLQERQKYLDVLSADLQLQQTQVNLMRQEGGLGDWIHASLGVPATTPAVAPQTNTPTVPGSSPVTPVPTPTTTPSGQPTSSPSTTTPPR